MLGQRLLRDLVSHSISLARQAQRSSIHVVSSATHPEIASSASATTSTYETTPPGLGLPWSLSQLVGQTGHTLRGMTHLASSATYPENASSASATTTSHAIKSMCFTLPRSFSQLAGQTPARASKAYTEASEKEQTKQKGSKRREPLDPWKTVRINERITSPELRVLQPEGGEKSTPTGVIMPLNAALQAARSAGLDLIELPTESNPPVARIMDFGKWKYEQQQLADNKSKSKREEVKSKTPKECYLSVKTAKHDEEVKLKRVQAWLDEGRMVSMFIEFKKAEMQKEALASLERIIKSMEPIATADPGRSVKGKTVGALLRPKKQVAV
eukprot:gene8494-4855_t